MKQRLMILLTLLALPSLPLHAQTSDTILPNPNAVLLRKIWMIQGEAIGPNASPGVGDGAGNLGDLSSDSLTDFAVRVQRTGLWHLFYGASPMPDTTSQWSFESPGGMDSPVIGDFWGNGITHLGFLQYRKGDTNNSSVVFFQLYLFADSGSQLATQPTVIVDPEATMEKGMVIVPYYMYGVNLDHQIGDELIIVTPVISRNNQRSTNAELWFYKGGPDFQVEEPTKIIVDEDENDDHAYSTAFADVDGDHYVDMVIGCGYPSGPKLKIWYGREGSPWNWTSTPDRVISSVAGFPWFSNGITALDVDGDSVADLVVNGNYIFRSGSGKNARTRSFSVQDADHRLVSGEFFVRFNAGPLNNPQHRYDMVALVRPGQDRFASSELRVFSGGSRGVDSSYEAYYRTDSDGLTAGNSFQHVVPLSDCNGDGWSDLLIADPKWWGFDQGIAIILAGGPYIPHDDPTVDVQELPAEGKSNAISIWPNPVCDRLNIAWHGRLQHSPARMTIHDLTGRLVASGATDGAVGAMQWNAAEIASGCYRLTVYDADGGMIASTQFIKQP